MVYKMLVRPAMMHGLERVTLRKRQKAELEVAKLNMLIFLFRVARMDGIRSEYIRGTIQAERFGVREVRLRQFGHVQRRDRGYIGQMMLNMGG